MPHTNPTSKLDPILFVDKREMSRLTGLSMDHLKRLRLSGVLKENIHWVAVSSRSVRYAVPLVLDWLQHRNCPELHNEAIENYNALLLAYQGKRKRR